MAKCTHCSSSETTLTQLSYSSFSGYIVYYCNHCKKDFLIKDSLQSDNKFTIKKCEVCGQDACPDCTGFNITCTESDRVKFLDIDEDCICDTCFDYKARGE